MWSSHTLADPDRRCRRDGDQLAEVYVARRGAEPWAPRLASSQLAGVVDSLRTPTPTASSTPPTATMATTSRPVNGSLLFGSVLCSMRADVLYPCSADVAAPAGDATNRSATSDAIASSAVKRRVTCRFVLSILELLPCTAAAPHSPHPWNDPSLETELPT